MAREQRPHLTAMLRGGRDAGRAGSALPPSVAGLLYYLTERWDGRGPLRRAKGEDIPLPMRIVNVATDAALQRQLGGVEHAARLVRERAGHAFDPAVAACLADGADEILTLDQRASAWDETLSREPGPPLVLTGEALDRALAAMGNFADLISPFLAGHSAGVAELAAAASRGCRMDAADTDQRCGVPPCPRPRAGRIGPRIWQKPGPLNADEWEQVRLHPYHTERVPLAVAVPVGACAGRGCTPRAPRRRRVPPWRLRCRPDDCSRACSPPADAYHAMTEPRPHRARDAAGASRGGAGP